MAKIEIKGLDELQKAIKEVTRKAPDRIEKKINEIGEEVRDEAKENTPVKTGNLKKGFTAGKTINYGTVWKKEIYNDAPHAHLVEDGHRLISHKGEFWGWVHGSHMLEKTVAKKNKEIEPELQMWLMELYKELEG